MSKFKTTIPVDVEGVRKLLPPGAYIHDVEFDDKRETVELHWEHDQFVTPLDHASEFPIANLREQKLPAGVTLGRRVSKPAPVLAPEAKPQEAQQAVQEPPAPVPLAALDKEAREAVAKERAQGEKIEEGGSAIEEERPVSSSPVDLAAARVPTESEAPLNPAPTVPEPVQAAAADVRTPETKAVAGNRKRR